MEVTQKRPENTIRRLLAARRWWLLAGVAVIAGAALGWALWPRTHAEPPRARQYLEYTACLLTGERGITDPAAVPVWAGMQDASLATHAKVAYLAIAGPQTVDNGVPFLNSLAQTGCNLVFAAGDLPVATVENGAATFPKTRFLPVGPATTRPNVSPIRKDGPDAIRGAVRDALTAAVAASGQR